MINGRIISKRPNGDIVIRVDADCQEEVTKLLKRGKNRIIMQQFDPKMITRPQQQKAHALINDINNYSDNDFIKNAEENLKKKFCYERGLPAEPLFSLSNCSKDIASQFIGYLVDYCFVNDIPFDSKDLHLSYDVNRLMFLSALHNRCFVTQARRQDAVLHIHHVNAVGRGSRQQTDHRGRYYMILRAEMHNEIHDLGYWQFCEKWHCGAIKLSDEQIYQFGLMSRRQMQERDADPDYEIRDWQLPERK